MFLNASANEKLLLQKQFLVNAAHDAAWVSKRELEGTKIKGNANSTSLKYVAWVRKGGNDRERFKVNISLVFPKCFLICAPTQHHVEDTKSASQKAKNVYEQFSENIFWRPGRNFASATTFPFCTGL